jgi:YD repeat-containing protein
MTKIVGLILISFLAMPFYGASQYYFNDIVSQQLSKKNYLLLKQHGIKQIKAISYNDDNTLDKTFNINQKISKNAETIVTNTTIKNQPNTSLTNTYNNTNLISSISNDGKIEITTKYQYNSKGQLTKVHTISGDTATNSIDIEDHIWQYNAAQQPVAMIRVKNKIDTLYVSFEYDEKGNVKEERWKGNGKYFENYFYYYNSSNMLTDVVRFNIKLNRFVPDYMYEFNEQQQLIKFTQVFKGGADYLVWQYTYSDKGLKQNETCYTKQGQMVGKIEYQYK